MFTWGSKYLFGISLAAFAGAIVYGLVTGGGPVGVISLGYKGGVGDHTGYTLLIAAGFSALFLGIMSVVTRDGDAEDMAQLVGSETPLAVKPPITLSISAPLAAFGIACLVLGVATSSLFIYLGCAVLFVVAVEWTIQAWSERATGDPGVNEVLRRRLIGPFEVPMLSMLILLVGAISLSRILLAVSETAAVVIVVAAAAFIFGSAILIAKARTPRSVVSALVSFGVVAVLAGGVVGAARGERDFHHHEEEHSEDGDHSEEGGAVEGVDE